MFLRWVNGLGLLPTEEDTNILLNFSYTVKKTVVSEVVNHLLDPETSPKILTTPTHVRWVLEVIGQGFTLPIEDVPIMEKCIALYSKWLLSPPELRPPGFKVQDQYFYQRMYFHLSNLFEPRARDDGPASVAGPQNQVKLCKDVLDSIYLPGAQKLQTQLTQETWESWLKLMLGVVDSIFRNRGNSGAVAHSFLIKSLGPPAFRVLCEMWLLSKTENPDLWNSFLTLAPSWLIVPTVVHWNSLCLGLTNRTLGLMYGKEYGPETVSIDWLVDDKNVVKSFLSLPTEYVYFAWHKFLHILPNPNTQTDPEIFRNSFLGIAKLVDAYLNVAEQLRKDASSRKKPKTPPSGNTILAIFGRWLFEAVLSDKPGLEEGTSVALATLCRIFSRDRGTFLSVHLASFYSCLEKVLLKDINDKVLSTVLLNSRGIFVRELHGSFGLLPYYFHAFSRVWRENGPEPNIRSACIDILATLISFADHYGDVKIISRMVAPIVYSEGTSGPTPSEPFSRIDNVASLRTHIQFLMSRAIVKEESARNIQRLLWCVVAMLLQLESRGAAAQLESPDLKFAEFIIAEILRRARKSWAADVIMVAFSALSSLTAIYKFFGVNKFETCRGIVGALADSALNAMNASVNDWEREDHDRMLHRTLITMTDWMMIDPEFTALCDQNTYSNLLRSLATVMGAIMPTQAPQPGTKPFTPSANTRAAAHFALNNLLYHSGQFPLTVGPHRISSEVCEEDILAMIIRDSGSNMDMEQAKQFLRYFILDGNIVLTLIDLPNQPRPTIIIITRDSTGKHVWTSQLRFYEDTDRLNPAPNAPELNQSPITPQPVNLNKHDQNVMDQLYTELLNYLPSVWAGRYYESAIAAVTESYIPVEEQFLQQRNWNLQKDVKLKIPAPKAPYEGECKFVFSRIFLAHLGLLLPENFGRLQVLEHGRKGFDEALGLLDTTNEREAFSVGVVLMEKIPTKKFDYLVAEGGPADYQEFLSAVGWAVNLWEHTGYRGGLIDRKCGDYAPYHANYSTEIIFNVCTWMPNNIYDTQDKVIAFKRRVLAQNNVTIVWNLLDDYDPSAVTALQKDMVQIVITPLASGMYHCRVFKDNKPFVMGPLLDSMVLSKRLLGEMVRRTALLANRMLTMERFPVAPFQQRKSSIENFASTFSRQMPYDEYLMYMFSKKVPEQAGAAPGTTQGPPSAQGIQPLQPLQQQGQNVGSRSPNGSAVQVLATQPGAPQPQQMQPPQQQYMAPQHVQPTQPTQPAQQAPPMQHAQQPQQPAATAPASPQPQVRVVSQMIDSPFVDIAPTQQPASSPRPAHQQQGMLSSSSGNNLAAGADGPRRYGTLRTSPSDSALPVFQQVPQQPPNTGAPQPTGSPRPTTPTQPMVAPTGAQTSPSATAAANQQPIGQGSTGYPTMPPRPGTPSVSAGGAPKGYLPPVIGAPKQPAPGPAGANAGTAPANAATQSEKSKGGFARFFGGKKDEKDPKKK